MGRGPGTRGPGGGVGEVVGGVPGAGDRDKVWGRSGEESQELGAGSRGGDVGRGVPGAGGR